VAFQRGLRKGNRQPHDFFQGLDFTSLFVRARLTGLWRKS
jgi:hypothetical protein